VGIYAVDIAMPQRADDPGRQKRQNRLLVRLASGDTGGGHFACVGRGALRDWCFAPIGAGDDHRNGGVGRWRPYEAEILMLNVLTGEVRRLAHHRSRGIGRGCVSQPRVSTDWLGTLAGWASNFNAGDGTYSDVYALTVPGDVVSRGAGAAAEAKPDGKPVTVVPPAPHTQPERRLRPGSFETTENCASRRSATRRARASPRQHCQGLVGHRVAPAIPPRAA